MTRYDLVAGLTGSRAQDTLQRVLALPYFRAHPPEEMDIDRKSPKVGDDWARLLAAATTEGRGLWPGNRAQIGIIRRHRAVIVALPDAFATPREGFSLEVCSLGGIWPEQWRKLPDFDLWSLGLGHVNHGWGCAFRGAGHDRLVSRRWLDFGPWRVIRRPDDTTFIQFHDLALTDPAAAYAQARPGHQRMGIDPIGGYIGGIDLDVIAEVHGVYRAEARTLDIVIPPGAEVSQQDMRVACGLRLHHRLTQPATDRIDHVAYVFVDQADARAHLHELWLRELACWYLDETGKHRLDLAYHPTPSPPAWVTALEARGE